MLSFKKIFTAPNFDDESKNQQAYLLNIILWTLICVPIPFVIYAFLLRHDNLSRTLLQAAFGETVNIILLMMLRRGYVKAASIIQVSAFWFFFTVTALTGNGVQSEAYLMGYGLVIAIAGIFFGGVGASTFTFLSIVAGSWMVYNQIQINTDFSFDNSPLTTWIVSLVLFPIGAVLQHLASRNTKNALERARTSEEKYRLISRVSTDYVFASDVNRDGETKLVWVTGAFTAMTGYTYEEYVASGEWPAHVLPEDAAKDALDMETLKKNQDLRSEIRTFSKNGQIRWERIFAHPIWDEKENRLTGIIGAVQDVTEQKQAEEALRESEAIYRQAIEVSGAVPYQQTFDEHGNIHYDFMSEGIREITGYGPEEFNDTLWDSLTQERHLLEDLSEYSLEEAIQSVRLGKNPIWKCEHRIKARDGKIHWVFEAAVDLRDKNGVAYGSVGLYQDITERKLAVDTLRYERDLLQIFMDNIPDTVYFKDTESRFVRVNQAQARFLNINDPQEAIGKTDLDFQKSDLSQKFIDEEKQILETGQSVLNRIEFNPTAEGKPRWLSATKVPVKDASDQISGIIGISRDVTEQKIAQELEQYRRVMLEKVIKLGQHVTEVHDLRTTLIRIWNGVHNELGFDRLGIYLYDPEHNSMNGTFGTNIHGEMIDEWHTWFPLETDNQDAKPFLQALEQPDTVFFTNSYEDDFQVPKNHIMSGVKDHALIGAWAGEKPVAIIGVDQRITGRPITKEQLEALRLFAGYAGLAIENARLNAALEDELSQRGETLQKQSAILNGIPDMAWLKDKESRYIAVNEQFANMAGLKMEEIVGKTDFDLWKEGLAEKYRNEDTEVMQSRQRKNTEVLEFDSSGREFWVENTITPILDSGGEVIGTTGIAREITGRKKAQEAEQQRSIILEKVVQLGKHVTASDDLRSTVKKIWHGVHDDLGFDRLAIFLFNPDQNSMDDTFGTSNTGEMVDHWHLSFPIGSTFAALLRNPNGLYFTVNYAVENEIPEDHEMYGVKDFAAVAAWAGNKPVAVICTDQGITHRSITGEQLEGLRLFAGYAGLAIENARLNSALEGELSQRKNFIVELEAKNAELERFTYTVSHDLKSPLVTIKGFLGYLEKDAQAGNFEKLKHDKLRIESAVEKMQNLLKDLLELSRIGRLINSPVEIAFNEIVKDALEIVHGQIEAGKVLVEVKSSDILIKCDRIRLTEVLQNLMDNAIKFMGTQPAPHIEIGNFLHGKENVFYVKDNGIGIAPEFHGKIFGLFDKLTNDSDGTGIGLALVKRIIEVHGGRVWVESQIEQGTTFYFTLAKSD